jgi:lipopolysaccharide/colanic/teichoic acid biosynthesis glycosyltransferase
MLDLAVLAAGSFVVVPAIGMIGLAAWVCHGRPVFYRQKRPGQDNRVLEVCKFRTMSEERDATGALLPDGRRITKFGYWLRRWSLDEIPQLVNVLTGEMSLVGPRPLLIRYLPRYNARQRLRQAVKPGITGWSQISGRNAVNWEKRLEMDVWYVENWSLGLDVRILFATVAQVLRKEGVLPGAGAELDEFWGSEGPPCAGPRAFPVEADESPSLPIRAEDRRSGR